MERSDEGEIPQRSGFSALCSVIGETLAGMATTSRTRRREADKKTRHSSVASEQTLQRVPPTPSDETLNNLRTAFQLLDRNSDGRVTPEELQDMLKKLGIQVRDDLIADLIKDASKTGDGTVDENDFMQWIVKIQALQGILTGETTTSSDGIQDTQEEITRDLLAAFRVFDRDCNGYITRDELRSALELIGESFTDAQLTQVLALGDVDKDGRIDYEEFVKLLL